MEVLACLLTVIIFFCFLSKFCALIETMGLIRAATDKIRCEGNSLSVPLHGFWCRLTIWPSEAIAFWNVASGSLFALAENRTMRKFSKKLFGRLRAENVPESSNVTLLLCRPRKFAKILSLPVAPDARCCSTTDGRDNHCSNSDQ